MSNTWAVTSIWWFPIIGIVGYVTSDYYWCLTLRILTGETLHWVTCSNLDCFGIWFYWFELDGIVWEVCSYILHRSVYDSILTQICVHTHTYETSTNLVANWLRRRPDTQTLPNPRKLRKIWVDDDPTHKHCQTHETYEKYSVLLFFLFFSWSAIAATGRRLAQPATACCFLFFSVGSRLRRLADA